MPSPLSLAAPLAGGRRGMSVKTLKRALKKAGLKTSGRKAALTRRAKKAHLLRGGANPEPEPVEVPAGSPPGGEPMGENPVGGASVKTLKRALKKAGLKTSGRKSTLTKRAKKAHLKIRGGVLPSRSNADGVKPGDEDTKPSDEPTTSTSSSGLSNKTPEPSGAEVPFSLPSRSGGRHRRSHKWAY